MLHLTDNLVVGGCARVMHNLESLADRRVFTPMLAGLGGAESYVAQLREDGAKATIVGNDLSGLDALLDSQHQFAAVVHRSGEETPVWNRVLPALKDAGATVLIERSIFGYPDRGPASGHADLIFCNSLHTLWRHWRASGRPSLDEYLRRHRVIYNPVVLNPTQRELAALRVRQRETLNIPSDAFVVGDVCRPTPDKLDFMMASIMPRLCREKPDVYFVARRFPDAVADGMVRRLGDRFRNLPVTNNLADIAATYAALDVLVHMSTMGESFGMAIAEAMRCGLPVIANETPRSDQNNAQIELIVHGKTGFLASDPLSVLRHLRELARSPELLQTLGAAAKARFEVPPLSPASVIQQLESEIVHAALAKGWEIPRAPPVSKRQPSNQAMREYLMSYAGTITGPRAPTPWREVPWRTSVNARRWLWRVRRKLWRAT